MADTKEKVIAHPLEAEFNITSNTTVVEVIDVVPVQTVATPEYDDKDVEIEEKLDTIYKKALAHAEALGDEIEMVEGRYKARVGEVAATMLNVALASVREKSHMKQHKDKLSTTRKGEVPTGGGGTTNNTLVVANHSELLKLLQDQMKPKKP